MNDQIKVLAAEVLAMMDLQQEYFKTRTSESLAWCRMQEKALRNRCKSILADDKPEPSLFS